MPSPDLPPPRPSWQERFSTDEYRYGTEPNDFLRASVNWLPPGRVLSLAEGEGRNAVYLASRGYAVSSIDLTEASVAKTLRLAASRGVSVDARVGDLANATLDPPGWQGVVSIFAHVPHEVRARLHGRVVRSLAPGGVLVLEAYTPEQIGRGTGGPPVPELAMTLTDLRRELAGLEFIHARELEREVREGRGHTGLGSVVQLIARRPA